MEKPYQGIRTFLKAPMQTDTPRKIAILGIPFDCATTNRSGARFGPAAIRDASLMLTDGYHPVFETNPVDQIVDLGDIPVSNTNVEKSIAQIEQCIDNLEHMQDLKNHLICLGGDHAVTLGILRSITKRTGPLALVHFDAHTDTSVDHLGDPIGHGTWLRNAIDEKLINANYAISIGVRAPAGLKSKHYLAENGGTTLSARQAMAMTPSQLAALIKERVDTWYTNGVYLSFDVDSLDPSMAPGTGTPEVGGLTTMFVLEVLEHLKDLNWAGMDVVEVSPSYDNAQITALAAATVAWTYACMVK